MDLRRRKYSSSQSIAALCLLSFCLSCQTVKVTTDWDPDVDFSKFTSYAWMDNQPENPSSVIQSNTLLTNRIEAAVESALNQKGFKKEPLEKASFEIQQHISVDKKLQVDTHNYGYGYGPWYYGVGGYSDTTVRQYEEGTLIIDFVEPKSDELIWRGTGQSRIRASSTPEQRQERIREAVNSILARFPPDTK